MLNVLELERQWRRYKIRRSAPYFLLALLFLLAVPVFLLWSNRSLEPIVTAKIFYTEKTEPESNNITNTAKLQEEKKELVKSSSRLTLPVKTVDPQETITVEEPELVLVTEIPTLSPSLGFVKRMKNNLLLHENDAVIINQSTSAENMPKDAKPILSIPVKKSKLLQTPQQESVVEVKIPTKAKIQLKPVETIQTLPETENISMTSDSSGSSDFLIVRKYDNKDLRDVMHRFEKNRSPALSLFITKRFYALGDYQQAYNYALITNEIDNDIEDSWIIFSKSLVKLDQKELAVSTLKSYITQSHSIKASILLDDIKKGKFK